MTSKATYEDAIQTLRLLDDSVIHRPLFAAGKLHELNREHTTPKPGS